MNYSDYNQIVKDTCFHTLYKDYRWQPLINLVLQNKEKEEAHFDKILVIQLDSIYNEDQNYRKQLDSIQTKFGWQSTEVQKLWQVINLKDSLNLIEVKKIIDKHGWLGADIIGKKGNQTLFLVIQHADIETQKQYLPLMRAAVNEGKAQASSLALLEDRVALGSGKCQIYGSQIMQDETGYYVQPLKDPRNVNERRQKAGLGTIEEYLQYFNLKWNVEEYLKKLPELKMKFNIKE
ncbi:hypothetical protein GCM10011514_41040 [Emticicia aquatilis]|uniref:Uncharacterized protein n=2 Tax=Emticicia aquatilis TaxID=1537369 RepID=A0A916Z285_9BACT|nr:hypothetical protein GCM10011514_41040 [Emticicia aquatilis]